MNCAFCGRNIKGKPYWGKFCHAMCAVDFTTGEKDRRPFLERENERLEMQEAEHAAQTYGMNLKGKGDMSAQEVLDRARLALDNYQAWLEKVGAR